jgi:hypothetical protein
MWLSTAGHDAGKSVTVAVDDFVPSATLVAITFTVCCVAIDPGAVYNPVALIVPTAALSDHVTPVFPDPVTVAVNCWVWFARKLTDPGATATVTGVSVIVAVAVFVPSATLIAVTVTVC